MDVEVTQTTTTGGTAVKPGDSIPTIQEKIKLKERNTLASCADFQIKLHQSTEQTEPESINETAETEVPLIAVAKPMIATVQRNADVSWGTVEQPLIVYTPDDKNGKCILVSMIRALRVCVRYYAFVCIKIGTS